MSDYGADADPDIPKAQDLAFTKGLLPLDKTNVMQWTYPSGIVVRKLANKQNKSNVLVKMGLDPVPAGDPCTVCWGNGKPFGVGETPESVTVVIADVEKGPGWMAGDGEPPNGTFELAQNPVSPCRYQFSDDDYFIEWLTLGRGSLVGVTNKPSTVQSFLGRRAPCQTFYENEIVDKFIGGTATIFIPPIA